MRRAPHAAVVTCVRRGQVGVDEAGGSGSAEADSRRAEEGGAAAGQAGGGWARAVQAPRDRGAQEVLGDDQFAGFSDRVDSWLVRSHRPASPGLERPSESQCAVFLRVSCMRPWALLARRGCARA